MTLIYAASIFESLRKVDKIKIASIQVELFSVHFPSILNNKFFTKLPC